MKKKPVLAFFVSIFFLGTTLFPIMEASTPTQTTVYFDPSYTTAAWGETFNVNVSVTDVADLCGWEFKVFWNSSVLKCVSDVFHLPPGCNWEDPNNIKLGPGIENDYNTTHGRYFRGLNMIGMAEPYPVTFNGSTVLVTLTFNVTDIGECSLSLYQTKLADSEAKPIPHTVVQGYFKPSGPPRAFFTYKPTAPFVNQIVTFDASDSKSCEGRIVSYAWSFGDDSTVTETDPVTTHAYTAEGQYLVTLNVTDSEGLQSTASKSIEIFGPCGPTANFIYSPEAPSVNGTVTFDASVSEPGWNGADYTLIVTYEWNFGDGTSILIESDPVVTHVFVNNGSYNVVLKVTDIQGQWNSISHMIQISPKTAIYVAPSFYYGEVLGEIFTVEVIAVNVHDVLGFEFKLDYDTTVLDAIDIALGPFLKEPTYVPGKEINDEIGSIEFAATSLADAAEGDGVLATVTFEVKGVGLCIFNLHDFRIFTPSASPPESPPVWVPVIHNVAIVSATPSKTEAYVGHVIYITVVARNSGNAVETFNVTVYCNTDVVGVETVPDLDAGGEVTLPFTWNTAHVEPCCNYTIKAEVSWVPDEISVADNLYNYGTVSIRIMGDVNGNGVTDINDVVKAGLALASYPGHPRWDPNADLNNDGFADIFDLVLIARNFGKTA